MGRIYGSLGGLVLGLLRGDRYKAGGYAIAPVEFTSRLEMALGKVV